MRARRKRDRYNYKIKSDDEKRESIRYIMSKDIYNNTYDIVPSITACYR